MVLFTVSNKENTYPFIVLNGKHFYLKIQEIVLGKNNYRNYFTINGDSKDIKISVLDIDVAPEEINKVLYNEYIKVNKPELFNSIRLSTIEENYGKISMKQNFDFYLNLRDTYSVEKLTEIIWLFIYKNVSATWLSVYFEIDKGEIDFILKYLPVYYNYLEFDSKWHT